MTSKNAEANKNWIFNVPSQLPINDYVYSAKMSFETQISMAS